METIRQSACSTCGEIIIYDDSDGCWRHANSPPSHVARDIKQWGNAPSIVELQAEVSVLTRQRDELLAVLTDMLLASDMEATPYDGQYSIPAWQYHRMLRARKAAIAATGQGEVGHGA